MMSILTSENLWMFLAGISIFLYGLELIEDVASGWSSAIQKAIQSWTNTKLKSVLSWVGLISVLQSSHAVSLLILAFVWWGLVSIVHGVGMVIGMNVGTVFTEALIWFFGLGFDIWPAVLPLVAIGWLWFLFNKRYRSIFAIILGLGLLFFGLDMMKDSVGAFKSMIDITKYLSYPLIIYFVVWLVGTILTQSSSAMTVIIMTAVYEWLIPLDVAAMTVMGCYVGTTTTALFVSLSWWALKKQVALSHFGFNIITSLIFGLAFTWIIHVIRDIWWFWSGAPWIGSLTKTDVNWFIVFFLLFKAVGAILFLPFMGWYTKLIQWIIPYVDEDRLNIDSINKEVSYSVQRDLFKKDWLIFQNNILDFNTKLINNPVDFDMEDYKRLKLKFNKLFTFVSNFNYASIGKDIAYWEKHFLTPIVELMQSSKSIKDVQNDILDIYKNNDNIEYYNFIKNTYNGALDMVKEKTLDQKSLDHSIHNINKYESKLISAEMKDTTTLHPNLSNIMHMFNNIELSLSSLVSAFKEIRI